MGTKKRTRLKVSLRVFLVSVSLVLAGVTVTSAVSSLVFVQAMRAEMDQTVLTVVDGLGQEIDAMLEHMEIFGEIFTHKEEVARFVEQRDTRALDELMFLYLKVSGFDTITITDADGTVLSRPHARHYRGDDISKKGYIAPPLKGEAASTVEKGSTIGTGLFYGVPLIRDSRIVGAIAMGINLGKAGMMDRLSSMYRAEVALFYGDDRVDATAGREGARILDAKADSAVVESVLQKGEPYYGELTLADGTVLRTLYKPFVFNGKRIGILSAGVSTRLLEQAIGSAVTRVSVAAIVFVLLAAGISYFFARSIATLSAAKTKQEIFLDLLMKNSPDAILIFDETGRFIDCSSVFLRQMGFQDFNAIAGKDFSEVFWDYSDAEEIERLTGLFANALRDKKNISLEKQIEFRGEESPKNYAIRFAPIVDEDDNVLGAIALLHDVTDFLQARQAEASSQAKSAFLSNMSHEIRTPLSAIMGLSEIELRNDLPDETHDNLEKIHRSGSILLNIINDILDLSKIESGKFEIIPDRYDFPNLISDAIHLNIVRIASKPIAFEPRIDENIPSVLYGDETRIKQILNNLLSNAFKYTKEGKVTLRVTGERQGDEFWLTCVVSDTGIGIKKEDLGKLFSEYMQFDTWNNRKIEGTGLGLSICKSLVDMMGGTIEAESEYGKGSTFTVKFRQGILDPKPIGLEVAGNLKTFRLTESRRDEDLVRTPMPYGKVLVVDDVVTNLDVAKGLMTPYGLTVHCATRGVQAVRLVQEEKILYDVIFMDHVMPDMDGIEAVRVIRNEIGSEYARNVPIIALTANAIFGIEELFLQSGFQGFLSKPIDVVKLDALLNEWVRDKQTGKVLQEKTADLSVDLSVEDRHDEKQEDKEDKKENKSEDQDKDQNKDENGKSPDSSPPGDRIRGVNVAMGMSRLGDAYLKILLSYAVHTSDLLETIRAVTAQSLSGYAITVHGVKGASRGIYAEQVGNMAEELERAAKNGDFETVRSKNDAFIQTLETLLSDIRALHKKNAGDAVISEETLLHL
ncbi:MAG: response regulator, partial [Synergistaceae bacterium]|nr:response regulator [Synergistaceae bacterium]